MPKQSAPRTKSSTSRTQPAARSYGSAKPKQARSAAASERPWPSARSTDRPGGRSSAQTGSRSGARPDARADARFEARPEARSSSRTTPRAVAKPAASSKTTVGTRPAPAATAKPFARPAARSAAKPAETTITRSNVAAPGAKINRRAADRIRGGHLWVYSSDVETLALPESDQDTPSLLPVADSRGLLLGTALYSPTSQIALRMVARHAIDEAEWLRLLEERLRRALQRRKALLDSATDACRLCFSEADELPGVIIDKYGPLVVVQLLTKGLDTAAVRKVVVEVLRDEIAPKAILERPDARMRELEGLSQPGVEPLWAARGAAKLASAEFHLNGLTFHFDANSGQKTGAFLDQRMNYAAAAGWAERLGTTGRVLDVCTYQGGFALHLARVAKQVTGLDASHASLEVAEKNLEANRKAIQAEVDWVEGDAFQVLRDWSDADEQFDAIVLDPPAFAKSKRAIEGALRGYKELNLRAMKMLRPGGLLVTCSCSHHVGWQELEGAVAAAAADAGRRVRVLERRGPALDHPVVLNLAETEYLKCLILEVE